MVRLEEIASKHGATLEWASDDDGSDDDADESKSSMERLELSVLEGNKPDFLEEAQNRDEGQEGKYGHANLKAKCALHNHLHLRKGALAKVF